MTTALLLHALLALLTAVPATCQDGDGLSTTEARAALQRALHFQRGEVPRSPPRTFHGRFWVTVRSPDKQSINAEVDRIWTRSPERMVTRTKDAIAHSDSSVGTDGEVVWFQDHRSGRVVRYSDDPETFEADLDQLRFQLLVTRLILDAAVLDSLVPRLADVRLKGAAVHVDLDRQEHPVQLVAATVPDELFGPDPDAPPPAADAPAPRLLLVLGIGVEDGALWSLHVETLDRSRPRVLDLEFALHQAAPGGLRVPGNIQLYEDGAERPSLDMGLVQQEDPETGEPAAVFELDVPADPEVFAPPEAD